MPPAQQRDDEPVNRVSPEALREGTRVGLLLDDDDAEALRQRILALLEEYATRRDPDGKPYGAYFALHLMDPEPPKR